MFEQSTLTSAPASKRLWTTGMGLLGQAALVLFAALAPMLWPQILPRAALIVGLTAPGPPPRPPQGGPMVRPRTSHPTTQFVNHALVAPVAIPRRPLAIEDPVLVSQSYGVTGGVANGARDGIEGGVLDSIIRSASPPAQPPPLVPPAPAAPAPQAAPAQPQRIHLGGRVKMARLLHRVEPEYPVIARQMRVSGVVEIEGVIGVDGRMREVRLVSGHPLLARAALEAVRQWIYEPTTLNGVPVEVVAPITVTFRLNQ